jgi:hypothetical protein
MNLEIGNNEVSTSQKGKFCLTLVAINHSGRIHELTKVLSFYTVKCMVLATNPLPLQNKSCAVIDFLQKIYILKKIFVEVR